MYIRRCKDMRNNYRIEILQKKLEAVGTEIGILIAELENESSNVEQEEIAKQLVQIQDFVNS